MDKLCRAIIWLQKGNYTLSSPLSIKYGVTLEGGFSVSSNGVWIKNSDVGTLLDCNNLSPVYYYLGDGAHYICLHAFGVSFFKIKDLSMQVVTSGLSKSSVSGGSLYGVLTSDGSDFVLSRLIITNGKAG